MKVAPRDPEYANMSSNTPGNCKPVQVFNVPSTIEIIKKVEINTCKDVPTNLEKKSTLYESSLKKFNCKDGNLQKKK